MWLISVMSSDEIGRKKKVRSAHRKSEIFKGLSSELLEATENEGLEAEIKQSDTIQEKIKLAVLELERIKTKCESPKKRVLLESVRVTRSTTPSRSPPLTLETIQFTLTNPRTEDPLTISSTNINKFNYLNSLLDRSAADAIMGLRLTSSNYEKVIDILKQRFGNKQLIINRHMEALLQLNAVTLNTTLKNLRRKRAHVTRN